MPSEVHYDGRGCFAEAVLFRPPAARRSRLKRYLRQAARPLALAVSEDIYWSIVRHEYDGMPESAFQPLVPVTVARQSANNVGQGPGFGEQALVQSSGLGPDFLRSAYCRRTRFAAGRLPVIGCTMTAPDGSIVQMLKN